MKMSFVELHTPLFLGGVNWGVKLYEKNGKGSLTLDYDREYKELIVKYSQWACIIPSTNIASMTLDGEGMEQVEQKSHAAVAGIERAQVSSPTTNVQNAPEVKKLGRPAKVINSQASTPHDHVFAGEGKGRTHD